jgi:signal transduction histidine kinase
VVVLAPVGLVAILGLVFERARPNIGGATEHAAAEVAALPALDRARVEAIAAEHQVDVRVFEGGAELIAVRRAPRSENTLGVASISSGEEVEEEALYREIAAARRGAYLHSCSTLEAGGRLRCRTIIHAGAAGEPAVVLTERSAVRSIERLTEVVWPLVLLSGVTLVLGIALATWLVVRLVAPLSRLRSAVLARKASAAAVVPTGGPREIRDVAVAFDELLASLVRERKERERLVADLAHELKSPLASLRTSIDVLAREGVAEPRREALRSAAERNVRRINATLAELLDLARAENGIPNEERVSTNVAALVRRTVETYESEHPDATLISVHLETAEARVAPTALARAVRALLENASAHASSRIEVRVRKVDRRIAIEVADDGPGLHEVDRAFERFHSRREGGTGLGLALVAAVAEAHGGLATARNGGGGAVIRIELADS